MTDTITESVIAMISTLGKVPIDRIQPESRLDELDIDSLVIVELSLKLKQDFAISEEADRELDNAETVQDIIDLVKESAPHASSAGQPSA